MKSKSLFAVALLLLTPALAFAGAKNSANFQLDRPVTVAGTQLAPGQYKVTWQRSGSDMTVSFTEGKKTIATAPAKIVSNPINQNALEMTTSADNQTVLQAVDVKNITLQFESAAPTAGN